MTVLDASDNAKSTTAAYVLVSFGANSHGAYTRNGGATRISSGSINIDEQNNCDCDSSLNPTALDGIFVQKNATYDSNHSDHTNDFDDIVVFATRADLRTPNE